MKTVLKIILLTTLFSGWIVLTNCSGSSSSSTDANITQEPAPSFTPTASESLDSMVINTFAGNDVNISVDPNSIDFNTNNSEIQKDDELTEPFTLQNNSGASRTFKFQIYSVSSGFSILDENKKNLGSWDSITIESGSSATFYVQFNAWLFGTQTSYLTISADVDGFIRLPFRASVAGASDFKIVPSGYLCSDSDAPDVDVLDFLKVAHSKNEIRSIKLCNNGGEDIKIFSAEIENDTGVTTSEALTSNAYEDFVWTVNEEVDATFAFGVDPEQTSTFSAPVLTDAPMDYQNPAGSFSVAKHDSTDDLSNYIIPAGKIMEIDVDFTPNFDVEAPEGSLYNPVGVNAKLTLSTSIGNIEVPLVGATSGNEPILKMYSRFSDSEEWRPVDLNSEGSAIYFGSLDVFLDWVSNNYSMGEIKIENAGSGSKSLDFYGNSLNGYFEYYWSESTPLSFPITLTPGESTSFSVRYLPQADGELSTSYETHWNFGQLYFNHTAGNGPHGKVVLVGEQAVGYAVELRLGGSELQHTYSENEYKNFCVFKIDDGSATKTQKSFTIYNNSKVDTLTAHWEIVATEGTFTSTPSTGDVTVSANSSQTFTIEFTATDTSVVKGDLIVTTSYGGAESTYASYLADLDTRDFDVQFKAQGSETGSSPLCSGEVLGVKDESGENDTTQVTIIAKSLTMSLTALAESTRGYPSFSFFWPLELDKANKRVRISKRIQPVYNTEDPEFNVHKQFRTPLHQATNNGGCPTLPTNPYKMEYERGSWTGPGYQCDMSYTDEKNSKTIVFNGDKVCQNDNYAEDYVDGDGVAWKVFYHNFFKYDTDGCTVLFHGKVATFAYRPDQETELDVLDKAEVKPNENEAYYEELFKAFQFDSYIEFNSAEDAATCGDSTLITDPDSVKECYLKISSTSTSTRTYGFVDECAGFYYILEEGVVPDDALSENPDYDKWTGYGLYEPYVDKEGNESSTKYDLTIYNAVLHAFMLRAGDRTNFFGHASHLLRARLNVTLTTKRVAEQEWENSSDWQQRIAVDSRPQVEKSDVFMTDGDVDIARFWTNDGKNSVLTNMMDYNSVEPGIDYGGFGRGTFRYYDNGSNKTRIIPAGWPVNYDDNNLVALTGMGVFASPGNTGPSFTKADSTTGKGKVISFSIAGCIFPGVPEDNQGCMDYKLDDAVMPNDSTKSVIDEYTAYSMLPWGYVADDADCSKLSDPGFMETDEYLSNPYIYTACVNFVIHDIDRDRYKNYYDDQKFTFESDPYGSSKCGYGM